ncbi:MAG: hypothetical protein OXC46_06575 [Thaumarchaeota archaeon]|nr:hypothetical protein [Nitrososphaerota archaeon]
MYRNKKDEITIRYEISHTQTVKTSNQNKSGIYSLFQEGIELRQRLKNHEKKWSTVENIDGFYFDTAIDAAILILDNAQFNFENIENMEVNKIPNATICFTTNAVRIVGKQEKTDQKPKTSFTHVFPIMSELIKNILDISESTEISKITEERENRVIDNMNKLIDIARTKNLVDFNKFKPDKAEAKWQYTFLIKSLDAST